MIGLINCFSYHVLCDKLYCWPALRLTITCGVGGVTARLCGVCCLRCESGIKCDDMVCCVSLCCAFCVTSSEVKLWFAPSFQPFGGGNHNFRFLSCGALEDIGQRFKANVCSSPTLQNGPAGYGCNRV
jgi:hypothetical protein